MSIETPQESQNVPLTNGDTSLFNGHIDAPPQSNAFNNLERGMNELVHIINSLRSIHHYMEAVDFEDVLDALKRQRPDFEPTERATTPWTFVAQLEVLERVWRSLGFAIHFVGRAYEAGEWWDRTGEADSLRDLRVRFGVRYAFRGRERLAEGESEHLFLPALW